MREYTTFKVRNHAISDVVGGMILVLVAVISFTAIYFYLLPEEPEDVNPVRILGYVTDEGVVILQHDGGSSIESYKISVTQENGSTNSITIDNDKWVIGETKKPLELVEFYDLILYNESVECDVSVYIINEDQQKQVFTATFSGKPEPAEVDYEIGDQMLISSLRTNTTDEDLICFNNTIASNISAKTYIYNWLVDGQPFADLYLPFDTEDNSLTKDYSGSFNNGTITGATWTNDGVVGGGYYLDGSGDYISGDLPDVFNDIAHNDFTVSAWVKTSDETADWKVLLEARYDNKNFLRVFQEGTQLHFSISDDGTKHVVRTENISSDTWYHVTGVWKGNSKYSAIYLNGNISLLTGNRHFPFGAQSGFNIGHGTAGSGGYWDGYVDEFMIYNTALSDEQVYQNYLCTKDGESKLSVIVSQETNVGEIWQCIVTPNNAIVDDIEYDSNQLQIISYGGGG